MNQYESNNENIVHNDRRYYFIQEAHREVDLNSDYDYQAIAENEEGEQILVTWCKYPDYNGDEDSDSCDWDNYTVIGI